MEPQLEGCGKRQARARLRLPYPASMEPQLEGCGKLGHAPAPPHAAPPASMEPQLEGCGKDQIHTMMHEEQMLQWSRNLRVAESSSRLANSCAYLTLQWSRNLRVAESA